MVGALWYLLISYTKSEIREIREIREEKKEEKEEKRNLTKELVHTSTTISRG